MTEKVKKVEMVQVQRPSFRNSSLYYKKSPCTSGGETCLSGTLNEQLGLAMAETREPQWSPYLIEAPIYALGMLSSKLGVASALPGAAVQYTKIRMS